MQRKQGLGPIAEALADLPGPVQALQPSPPARRHFTLTDQVHQLVSASESDPDRARATPYACTINKGQTE